VRFTARRMSIVREALADEVLETQQPDVVKWLIAQVACCQRQLHACCDHVRRAVQAAAYRCCLYKPKTWS
jgi:hypothetical protein